MKITSIYRATGITFCALLITAIAGCSTTTMTKPSAIHVPDNLSNTQVSKAVRKALVGRGWTIASHNNNTYTAKLHSRDWQATVKIPYSKSNVQLVYGGSSGLDYHKEKGKIKINRHWNDWMRYLHQDIQRNLSNMANGK